MFKLPDMILLVLIDVQFHVINVQRKISRNYWTPVLKLIEWNEQMEEFNETVNFYTTPYYERLPCEISNKVYFTEHPFKEMEA